MLLALIEKLVDGYFARRPRRRPVANLCKHAVLIAHRGAHNNAQGLFENTLAAFQIAKEVGCWGIEFDVQATADGVLVVNHDPTLLRLWGHDVTITEIKFSELRALVPGVPSLAEVIAQYGKDLHLFIELKAPFSAEDALVQNLQGLTPVADYHLLSLDAPIFAQLKHFTKQALLLVAVHKQHATFL